MHFLQHTGACTKKAAVYTVPTLFSSKAALLPTAPSFFPWHPLHLPCYCLTSLQELTCAEAETQLGWKVWGDLSQCGAWCYMAQAVQSRKTESTAAGWDIPYWLTFSPLFPQFFDSPSALLAPGSDWEIDPALKKEEGGRGAADVSLSQINSRVQFTVANKVHQGARGLHCHAQEQGKRRYYA